MPGAVVENLPGNADELSNINVVADANMSIETIVAQGDWVAMTLSFDVSGDLKQLLDEAAASATPTAGGVERLTMMAMVRIECGEIAEAHLTSNALAVLLSYGWQVVPPSK